MTLSMLTDRVGPPYLQQPPCLLETKVDREIESLLNRSKSVGPELAPCRVRKSIQFATPGRRCPTSFEFVFYRFADD